MSGIKSSNITNYIKRGKINPDENGLFTTDDPVNEEFVKNKCDLDKMFVPLKPKNTEQDVIHEPESDEKAEPAKPAKPKRGRPPIKDKPKPTPVVRPPVVRELSEIQKADLALKKTQLQIKEEELKSLAYENMRKSQLLIPTELNEAIIKVLFDSLLSEWYAELGGIVDYLHSIYGLDHTQKIDTKKQLRNNVTDIVERTRKNMIVKGKEIADDYSLKTKGRV